MGDKQPRSDKCLADRQANVKSATAKLLNGTVIPLVGLGVYQTGPGQQTFNAVLAALKAGYRHIDTAALYRNEEDVGRALKESGVPRKDVFITTKLWSRSFSPEDYKDGYAYAMEQVEQSLDRLGTYIDLYLIHSPHHPQQRMSMWRAMEDLVKQGKVRSIGVSNYGVHHLEEVLSQGKIPPVVNQVELHPFLARNEIVAFCHKHDIRVEAYSPLAKATRFGKSAVVAKIAQAHKATEAQVYIRWSLQQGFITLPKSSNPDRIVQNAQVFGFELSATEMKLLSELDEQMTTGWDPTTLA